MCLKNGKAPEEHPEGIAEEQRGRKKRVGEVRRNIGLRWGGKGLFR